MNVKSDRHTRKPKAGAFENEKYDVHGCCLCVGKSDGIRTVEDDFAQDVWGVLIEIGDDLMGREQILVITGT